MSGSSIKISCKMHQDQTIYMCLNHNCLNTEYSFLCETCFHSHTSDHSNFIINCKEFFSKDLDINKLFDEKIKDQQTMFNAIDSMCKVIFYDIDKIFENLQNYVQELLETINSKTKLKVKSMLCERLNSLSDLSTIRKIYEEDLILNYDNFHKNDNIVDKNQVNRIQDVFKKYILDHNELEEVELKQQFMRISYDKVDYIKQDLEKMMLSLSNNLIYVVYVFSFDLLI